ARLIGYDGGMKLRFSLRTMFVCVAVLGVAMAWISYKSQRGWTVGKVERLIEREFNPRWGPGETRAWLNSKGIGGLCFVGGPQSMTATTVHGQTMAAYIGIPEGEADCMVRSVISEKENANVGWFDSGEI